MNYIFSSMFLSSVFFFFLFPDESKKLSTIADTSCNTHVCRYITTSLLFMLRTPVFRADGNGGIKTAVMELSCLVLWRRPVDRIHTHISGDERHRYNLNNTRRVFAFDPVVFFLLFFIFRRTCFVWFCLLIQVSRERCVFVVVRTRDK